MTTEFADIMVRIDQIVNATGWSRNFIKKAFDDGALEGLVVNNGTGSHQFLTARVGDLEAIKTRLDARQTRAKAIRKNNTKDILDKLDHLALAINYIGFVSFDDEKYKTIYQILTKGGFVLQPEDFVNAEA